MKQLLLLRHGNAEDTAPNGGDHQRALSDKGREEATVMAAKLAKMAIDGIHVSTATRTSQTAEIVIAQSGLDASRHDDDKLYLPSTGDLLYYVNQLPDAQNNILIIGHNPGLYELASLLSNAPHETLIRQGLPTCGLVGMHIDTESWANIGLGCSVINMVHSPLK